ncbi:MAG TPA: alpha-ribazole phosphatase CobZ [Methanothermobacter thermautotrophicus]|nr:alpha-ribazole phosphatase CobZ [Methanothermobacter thermautotrophicus]
MNSLKEKVNLNGAEILVEENHVIVRADSGLVTADSSISIEDEVRHELPGAHCMVRAGDAVAFSSAGKRVDVLLILGEPCGDRIPEALRISVEEVSCTTGILTEMMRPQVRVMALPGDGWPGEDSIRGAIRRSLRGVLLDGPGVEELLEARGVTIDGMVEAGMELLVGVDATVDLRDRLRSEIRRALGDLNVRALLAAALHLEGDIENRRVLGVDLRDDPAYLYSDEVLGMALANQVAGTKAIFNFKRYDEEKPGILGELGPMVDDAVAGLIAGCMSRIFE